MPVDWLWTSSATPALPGLSADCVWARDATQSWALRLLVSSIRVWISKPPQSQETLNIKCFLNINLNLYLWNIFIKNKSEFVCISSSVAILLVLVLVLEDVVGLHRTSQLQLLWHQCLGHKLGLLSCWMVCLGNKPRSFYCFWGCTQKLHFELFCWLRAIRLLLRDSWHSSRYNGHWIKFTHFSSLIPKMSMFTLVHWSPIHWFLNVLFTDS